MDGTVYHGLPPLRIRTRGPGDYFAFLGRIWPDKGIEPAIEIANRLSVPLKIAARIDRDATEYYRTRIVPLLDHPLIEFIGEIGEREKNAFLGGARALLFPIDWPEPFGLVMIEAMACGTPVVATRAGAVPEVDRRRRDRLLSCDRSTRRSKRPPARDPLDRRRCRAGFRSAFRRRAWRATTSDVYANLVTADSTRRHRRFDGGGA